MRRVYSDGLVTNLLVWDNFGSTAWVRWSGTINRSLRFQGVKAHVLVPTGGRRSLECAQNFNQQQLQGNQNGKLEHNDMNCHTFRGLEGFWEQCDRPSSLQIQKHGSIQKSLKCISINGDKMDVVNNELFSCSLHIFRVDNDTHLTPHL